MNGLTPNCINDFIFSNPAEKALLEMILARQMPFPFAGKSGILLHGTWGTGKSTLAMLLPELIEVAYSGSWNLSAGVSNMIANDPKQSGANVFLCGGGLTGADIKNKVTKLSSVTALMQYSRHHYFVIDEIDRLTVGAQQALRPTMDLKQCMFFCTTNNLSAIDNGIINRCHLIEMNQATNLSAYLPLANVILSSMGVAPNAVPAATLTGYAKSARGSMRDFMNQVSIEGVKQGGICT